MANPAKKFWIGKTKTEKTPAAIRYQWVIDDPEKVSRIRLKVFLLISKACQSLGVGCGQDLLIRWQCLSRAMVRHLTEVASSQGQFDSEA